MMRKPSYVIGESYYAILAYLTHLLEFCATQCEQHKTDWQISEVHLLVHDGPKHFHPVAPLFTLFTSFSCVPVDFSVEVSLKFLPLLSTH